jgi:hypothetical protein
MLPSGQRIMALGRSPFLAERVAIEATNGLTSAEVVLRFLRERSFLRQLLDGLTGTGTKRIVEVGSNLLTAQKALLALTRTVMEGEGRTQDCVDRVLVNLHAVNRDLDALQNRVDKGGDYLYGLEQDVQKLAADIESVRREFKREAAVNRLADFARAGELHPGAGQCLGAALYLAVRQRHYSQEPLRVQQNEWRAGLAVVKQLLPRRPTPTVELLHQAIAEVHLEAVEALRFVTTEGTGPMAAATAALLDRRRETCKTSLADVDEAFAAARERAGLVPGHLMRPYEFAAHVASELITITLGADPCTLKRVP